MIFPLEGSRGRFRRDVALAGTLWCAAFVASLAGALLCLAGLGIPARGDLAGVAATILATSIVATAVGVGLTWVLARRLFEASAAVAEPFHRTGDVASPAGDGAAPPPAPCSAFGKDPLTGLINQAALLAFADDAIPYFRRYRRGVSILMVEVDAFRSLLDTYRDDAAGPVLRHVAEVLDLSVRRTDKVARFDAHRFVVLLREINEADTVALAQRIRDAVADLGVRLADRSVSVTVSIGAALVSEHDKVSETLIERAEMALEASKTDGGNRVKFQPASDPTIQDVAW